MESINQEKMQQGSQILQEKNIDLWLIFVRETVAHNDPVLPLLYDHDLTWQSSILLTKENEKIAIIGHFEEETALRSGLFSAVIPYHESIKEPLLQAINTIKPSQIALDYSENDALADGLSHGLFKVLSRYLGEQNWDQCIISAEPVIAALRGRKTPSEIKLIKTAIQETESIYQRTFASLRPGMSEIEISQSMHEQVKACNLVEAWEYDHCPTVNAGPYSPIGHVRPTTTCIQPGQILHIDFGVKHGGYCSDIQRVAYFLAPDEVEPPYSVLRGFETVRQAITAVKTHLKPGAIGHEIDSIARKIVTEAGYPEYKYATGHQLGRTVHDGAGLLGPLWARYGDTPNLSVESGNIFTVEPGLFIEGYGYMELEEDVIVTEDGCEYLSTPQENIILIGE
jgi:Xaa-Pro aminopeptidase